MRKIELVAFGDTKSRTYECQYDWEEDCNVQGGESGIVFTNKGNYQTAFFEAFPKGISDYFRGEGETIEEAETNAWKKHRKVKVCPRHEYERRGETSGVGYCKHCNLRKDKAFLPDQYCEICGTPTNFSKSKVKKWYCQEHKEDIPWEERTKWQKGEKMNPLEIPFESLSDN